MDAALEACVVPGFSRIGLAVRSRLLPEYTADDHPGLDGRTILPGFRQVMRSRMPFATR